MAAEALVMMGEIDCRQDCFTQTPVVSVSNTCTQTTILCNQVGVQACSRSASRRTQTDFVAPTTMFSATYLKSKDEDYSLVKFYTGLPTWKVFDHVLSILLPHIPKQWSKCKLTPKDEFLLVLMRLRLNLLLDDLACRFCIAKSTVISIFNVWIDVMAVRLQFLIKWAPKEIVQANMPKIFKETSSY